MLPDTIITESGLTKASGLNLVTTAIVLWNTVYMERAASALRSQGQAVDAGLLQYLSPQCNGRRTEEPDITARQAGSKPK